jgi:ferric-chelate reductase (NADPH)
MANLKSVLLGSWLGDKLMRDTVVESVSDVGAVFRRATLRGLRAKVSPGDKIQIYIPDAGTRTYSPFGVRGDSFELALFAHGNGPGSAWVRALKAGDRVRFVGPQGSLGLGDIAGPVALFGDETSFGVAKSLLEARPDATLRFEVGDGVKAMADALGFPAESLVPRGDLAAVARDLRTGTLVLTGNAKSIQALRALLPTGPRQLVKSYWAPGKTGLD